MSEGGPPSGKIANTATTAKQPKIPAFVKAAEILSPTRRDKDNSGGVDEGNLKKTMELRAQSAKEIPNAGDQYRTVRMGGSSYLVPVDAATASGSARNSRKNLMTPQQQEEFEAGAAAHGAGGHPGAGMGERDGEMSEQQKNKIEHMTQEMMNADFQQQRGSSIRYRKMIENSMPEPPLYLLPMGKGTVWDIFVLLQNGVRKEVQDLFYIVSSMFKREVDLSRTDVADFYEWLADFSLLVEFYFEFEEASLFPWLEERMNCSGPVSRGNREIRKKLAFNALDGMDDCQFKFEHLPPGEVLPVLKNWLSKFANIILEHFRLEETDVIPLAVETFTEEEAKTFENRMLNSIRASDENHSIMTMLMRPIRTDEERVRDYQTRYLKVPGYFKQVRFRKEYFTAKKAFAESHTRLVYVFFDRWNQAHTQAEGEEFARMNNPQQTG